MATMRFGGEPLPGLPFIGSGKVRDSYGFSDQRFAAQRLVVASHRVSVFDIVLNGLVPLKGEVLTAINIFWRQKFAGDCEHDLFRYGADIDECLPPHLRGNPDLQKRAVVVHSRQMYPIEAIVRGYLTGTGYQAYRETGMVCGHMLPPGLTDGARLPEPIFTPTTKAEEGHDEHITIQDFRRIFGKAGTAIERLSLFLYSKASQHAAERGIIIADNKNECGKRLVLCDEVLTPDSSRFWKKNEWEAAQKEGKVPQAYDKQYVREWARGHGIHKLDPKNPDDYRKAREHVVPQEVLGETTRLYLEIFKLLVGKSLEEFQREDMNIAA